MSRETESRPLTSILKETIVRKLSKKQVSKKVRDRMRVLLGPDCVIVDTAVKGVYRVCKTSTSEEGRLVDFNDRNKGPVQLNSLTREEREAVIKFHLCEISGQLNSDDPLTEVLSPQGD